MVLKTLESQRSSTPKINEEQDEKVAFKKKNIMNLGKENFEINAFCMQLINILDIDQITIKIT